MRVPSQRSRRPPLRATGSFAILADFVCSPAFAAREHEARPSGFATRVHGPRLTRIRVLVSLDGKVRKPSPRLTWSSDHRSHRGAFGPRYRKVPEDIHVDPASDRHSSFRCDVADGCVFELVAHGKSSHGRFGCAARSVRDWSGRSRCPRLGPLGWWRGQSRRCSWQRRNSRWV
jgi:hypothetical protein